MKTIGGKSFEEPDERRTFPFGQWDVVHLGYMTAARLTLQPGWRWSEHVKPIVGTEWCQQHHSGYIMTGRMGVKMTDGTIYEYGPGDAYEVLPGHDGWVVSDEPVIAIEFSPSAATFATVET